MPRLHKKGVFMEFTSPYDQLVVVMKPWKRTLQDGVPVIKEGTRIEFKDGRFDTENPELGWSQAKRNKAEEFLLGNKNFGIDFFKYAPPIELEVSLPGSKKKMPFTLPASAKIVRDLQAKEEKVTAKAGR